MKRKSSLSFPESSRFRPQIRVCVFFVLTMLLSFTVKADVLVQYGMDTNGFITTVANGGTASGSK